MKKNEATQNANEKPYPFSFIRLRKFAYVFSALVFIGFLTPLIMGKQINWGIDFAGGIKIQVKLPKNVSGSQLKDSVNSLKLGAIIQGVGTKDKREYILSLGILNEKQQQMMVDNYAPADKKKEFQDKLNNKKAIDVVSLIKRGVEKKIFGDKADDMSSIPIEQRLDWQNAESVGPAVGSMLRRDGLKLFLIASMFMIMYLTFRFEFRYSVAAMVALVHDLFIISFFVALANIEINIPVLAALLTLLGYSINDTIVIFDRVRENTTLQSKVPFIQTIDSAIWQSMSRSLMTSITTLAAVSALIIFGGEALEGFSLTLFFGLFVGTYSSVFVASPVLYDWDKLFAGKTTEAKKPEQSTFSSVQ